MDKIFLSVLHEEEKMDESSLDMLKGGTGGICIGTNCKPNCSGTYNEHGQN
jgi:hypothetical protein